MALIACSECGKEVSDKAAACIHCGCPIDQAQNAEVPTPQIGDKIKEINGFDVNIDELVRDSRGNVEAMTNRLKFLTGISGSEAKRITNIAYRNRSITPMSYFQQVSERTRVCRKCGSSNIDFSNDSYGEFSQSKGTIKPSGNRAKHKSNGFSMSLNRTMAVCQDCGYKWTK